jgi:tyrosine-protein kinase Etk/Wzc
MERREINILDYLLLLYKGRKFILVNFVVLTIAAVVASFLLPKSYKSFSVLMPPHEMKTGVGFAEQLASSVTTLRLGTQGSPTDIYTGILRSQTVQNVLVDKFDLIRVYGVSSRDLAIKKLKSATDISVTKEGLIRIEYEDRSPQRAADVCNMYIAMLDSVNQSISRESSLERAEFLEKMLVENKGKMVEAENDLMKFQTETRAIAPFLQQQVSLSVTAELEVETMDMENDLKDLRAKSLTGTNPLVQDLANKLAFKREQLHIMQAGGGKGSGESVFLPLQKAPDLTMEYARLSNRVETLGMLDQILQNQYDEARIEELNTTSTVSVLDRAEPPSRKSKPHRGLIVLVTAAAAIFFSVIAVIAIEYFNHLISDDPENRRKVERLSRFLRVEP